MQPFSIIVAMDLDRGIGKDGSLPWRLPGDLKHFKQLTCAVDSGAKKNALVMGRKTWDSIPERVRPFPGRLNVVVTRNESLKLPEGVLCFESFDAALDGVNKPPIAGAIEKIFVIGGGLIYQEAVKNPHCRKIYLTQILARFDCDTFFPEFKNDFRLVFESPHHKIQSAAYYFAQYERKQ